MLGRLFVIVGGLIVLALSVALVGPHFVDWTSYRAEFEREATAVLGRRVTVEGEVTARILPFPSLTFAHVVVAGDHPGHPAMTAENFSMDAELAPFLRGEVLIFDMRLVKPDVRIDIGTDGIVDWAVRPSSPFTPGQIALERLTISDGRVSIHHAASGRTHVLDKIEANVSARSLAGPWRAEGSAALDGMATALEVSTGRADDAAGMRLRLRLDPKAVAVGIESDGTVRIDAGALAYSGTFRLGAGAPAMLKAAEAAPAGNAGETAARREGPRPYRVSGRFDFDHQQLQVPQFRFETGASEDPYTADGSASLDLDAQPRFAVEAKGAQVRLDEETKAGSAGAVSLADRLGALQAMLAALPRPALPGSIDIALPAVVAGDTTIRDVRLVADTAADGWAVRSFAATLPGRTTLEASGTVRVEGNPEFDGNLLLAVAQPSGFAAWVSQEVDEAVRRLPAAGFRARTRLSADRQHFSDIELILDKAKFHGEIDRRQPPGGRPAMQIKLAGAALDLEGARAFAALFVNDQGMTRLAGHDVDLDLKAGPVTVAGLTARTVDTALRLRDKTLEVDRLAIDGLEGATVSATGTLRDFPEALAGKLDASVVAVDLAPLLQRLADKFPNNVLAREAHKRADDHPGLFADTELDLLATAEPNGDGTDGLAVTASGKTGGSTLALTISANGQAAQPEKATLSMEINGSNDNAEGLLGLYGIPTLPLGLLPEAETKLAVKGTLAGGLDTLFKLAGKDFHDRFNGKTTAWDALGATGPIEIEAADIEPWLMSTGVGLPGLGFGLPVALAADLDYRSGTLALKSIKGTVEDGAVGGDLQVTDRQGLPHLEGALSVDQLELGPLAALVLGEQALESQGSGWPKTPFRDEPAALFSADLTLAAANLSAAGMFEASDVRTKASLDNDGLRLSEFQGKIFDGTLSGLFELKNTSGTGLLSTQFKLNGADLEAVLPQSGVTGAADISAQLSATGKSLEGMAAAVSGSGTAALHGLAIAGVNPDALRGLIAAADKVGRDVDAERTAAFAPAIVAAGTFKPRDAELAFTVAGGVGRAPPLALFDDQLTLTADLRADAMKGDIGIQGTLAYQPGDEKLAGSDPTLSFSIAGPPDAATRRFDTEPLAQFLTQRALEIEQARVEAMQAALLEKQRLRREVRYYAAVQQDRDRLAEETRRADEALRRKVEEERQRKLDEAAAREKAAADDAARTKATGEAAAEASQRAAAEAAEAAAQATAEQEAKMKKASDAAIKAAAQAATEAGQRAGSQGRNQPAEEALPASEPVSEHSAEALRLAERERARLEAERAARRGAALPEAPLPTPDPKPQRSFPAAIGSFLKSLAP